MLIVAGDQVPVIHSNDVDGKVGAGLFRQSGPIRSNVGKISLSMVISIVVTTPHWSGSSGVKVYVVVPTVLVLMVAGDQVPVIPLSEISGKSGAVLFKQSGPICTNVGTISGTISMSIVVTTPHWSGSSGVKV